MTRKHTVALAASLVGLLTHAVALASDVVGSTVGVRGDVNAASCSRTEASGPLEVHRALSGETDGRQVVAEDPSPPPVSVAIRTVKATRLLPSLVRALRIKLAIGLVLARLAFVIAAPLALLMCALCVVAAIPLAIMHAVVMTLTLGHAKTLGVPLGFSAVALRLSLVALLASLVGIISPVFAIGGAGIAALMVTLESSGFLLQAIFHREIQQVKALAALASNPILVGAISNVVSNPKDPGAVRDVVHVAATAAGGGGGGGGGGSLAGSAVVGVHRAGRGFVNKLRWQFPKEIEVAEMVADKVVESGVLAQYLQRAVSELTSVVERAMTQAGAKGMEDLVSALAPLLDAVRARAERSTSTPAGKGTSTAGSSSTATDGVVQVPAMAQAGELTASTTVVAASAGADAGACTSGSGTGATSMPTDGVQVPGQLQGQLGDLLADADATSRAGSASPEGRGSGVGWEQEDARVSPWEASGQETSTGAGDSIPPQPTSSAY